MRNFLDHLNGMQADQIIALAFLCSLPLFCAFSLRNIIVWACDLYGNLASMRAQNQDKP